MDWKAGNEQQQEALWRVFLMFIAMALLIIRTGLVSRGALAAFPTENAGQDATPAINLQPSSTPPSDLYQATLVLLCLAEAVGRLCIMMTREVWELMNQPLTRPAPKRPLSLVSLCERSTQPLDTS